MVCQEDKMKIALCFSGFARTFKHTYPYLKKYILDHLNPDVFFYGYTDIDNGISEEDIVNLYKPKKFYFKEYDEDAKNKIWDAYGTRQIGEIRMLSSMQPINILSQYYNLFNSNQLKKQYEEENNFKYDIVIRARTDCYFYRYFSEEELKVEKNCVYIPDIWDFGHVSSGFAYGDSESMDVYSDLFNKIRQYNLEEHFPFGPEPMKAYHINRQNLKRKIVQNHYWWDLADFKINGFSDRYIDNLTQNPSRRIYR